jgi:5-methylcytosine-specific restriction protein A
MALIGLPKREPVDAIKRRPLSKSQRDELFQERQGICYLCKKPIIGKWRDEHIIALHLGGTNEWENRAPVHVHCALAKNKKDMKLIAKGRRLRGETGNTEKKKIPYRRFNGEPVWK